MRFLVADFPKLLVSKLSIIGPVQTYPVIIDITIILNRFPKWINCLKDRAIADFENFSMTQMFTMANSGKNKLILNSDSQ